MSELGNRLQGALTASRKAQQKDRTLLLGSIVAALRNREIELKRPLTDEDVVDVLRKGVKTRRESVEQFEKGGRTVKTVSKVVADKLPGRVLVIKAG